MPALLPLLATTLLFAPVFPDDSAKETLKATLDSTKLGFALSASGKSYTAVFDHQNNRKQTVYVNTTQESMYSYRTHAIYTSVWTGTAPPSDEILKKALFKSKKIGHFYLFKDGKGAWAIRFGVQFDASETGEKAVATLKDLIYFVAAMGEETDLLLNGAKDIR